MTRYSQTEENPIRYTRQSDALDIPVKMICSLKNSVVHFVRKPLFTVILAQKRTREDIALRCRIFQASCTFVATKLRLFPKKRLAGCPAPERHRRCFALRNKVRQSRLQTNRNMKEHRNKYIKVRMTPEEVRAFKEKSAGYKTVSHYVRKALEEYSNVSVRKQLELMQELGSFYRRYQGELSHIGGNLNQAVKRANELAVAGLLPPSYIREVLLPLIRDTQETVNWIKRQLDILTLKTGKP